MLRPDSVVHATTKQKELERVRALISDLLSRTRFVTVEVDTPEHQINNPWPTKAGMFADDPIGDDFLKAMTDYRSKLDAEQVTDLP